MTATAEYTETDSLKRTLEFTHGGKIEEGDRAELTVTLPSGATQTLYLSFAHEGGFYYGYSNSESETVELRANHGDSKTSIELYVKPEDITNVKVHKSEKRVSLELDRDTANSLRRLLYNHGTITNGTRDVYYALANLA